ncbi:unnamed protein product, partial [Owenia fusiformis]
IKMAAPLIFTNLFRFLIFCIILPSLKANDAFNEELLVKPLHNGYIYTHFQFTTTWDIDITDRNAFTHYGLFPKSLGEVLDKYNVQELHLSLTQGQWRHEKWGYPVIDSPVGAELWVWFQENTQNIDKTWSEINNVLSGMFCASLNQMDKKSTITPKYSFKPKGVTRSKLDTKYLRYASLPREMVCTENLTPWKKLLPCGSKVGLASLLKAGKVYDASYHSLGLHYRPICRDADCIETSVELSQTLSTVFEPATQSSNGKQDWSIKGLFGKPLGSSCPLATTSKILVDVTSNKGPNSFTLEPTPSVIETFKREKDARKYAVYNIPDFVKGNLLSLTAKYKSPIVYTQPVTPPFYTHRFQTGYGQEKGGITCLLYNQQAQNATVVYMETVPWYIRMYLHSLTITSEGKTITPDAVHYVGGRDRERPFHLELVLTLPPSSITTITFQFERAFLKWTEYPPDANHGFYVSAAVVATMITDAQYFTPPPQESSMISSSITDSREERFIQIHTEILVVTLPTPDFSMPYNVICLACTVIAIGFGSIHNLTTRRFVIMDPNKKPGLLSRVKNFFKRKPKVDTTEGSEAVSAEGNTPKEKES